MMNTEDAKQRIKELIDKYTQLAEEKRIGKYNEEMTKKDFRQFQRNRDPKSH